MAKILDPAELPARNVVSILFNRIIAAANVGPGLLPGAIGVALAYLTLYPDERTCRIWSAVVAQCRRAGRPQSSLWMPGLRHLRFKGGCPLVTADSRDYTAVEDLEVVPIR